MNSKQKSKTDKDKIQPEHIQSDVGVCVDIIQPGGVSNRTSVERKKPDDEKSNIYTLGESAHNKQYCMFLYYNLPDFDISPQPQRDSEPDNPFIIRKVLINRLKENTLNLLNVRVICRKDHFPGQVYVQKHIGTSALLTHIAEQFSENERLYYTKEDMQNE
ncbi:MAG: hypothetical protein K2M17_05180, partial [Bacilli bacterium]|nr:hypothetical protein [Bacilli bacterium]